MSTHAAAPTPQAVAELLEEFLSRLCSGAESATMSAFAEIELSFSQVRMLMVLAYVDRALPINQLAGNLCLTLASAGRNVDRLRRDGLVERDEDSEDRRVKLVRLTPGGRELISRHFECHRLMLAEFAQRLPEPDRVRLAAALTPVLDNDLVAEAPDLARQSGQQSPQEHPRK